MPSQDEEGSAWEWSKTYFILGGLSVVFCFMRTHWGLQGGITAAQQLHNLAAQRVLMAPMSFYDATPTGRLLNRLSYDTEITDVNMTTKATVSLVALGWTITGVCIMSIISKGAMLVLLLPTFCALYRLQLYYRQSAVDLQRLDAISRSPLQSLLVEGIEGSAVIRAFGMQHSFVLRLRNAIDHNSEALLCWTAAQRWMGLRLDLYAALVAVGAAVIIATLRDPLGMSPSFAGMMMMWAFHQAITYMFLITASTEAELAATSVERVLSLAMDTPVEAPHRSDEDMKAEGEPHLRSPDADWPARGELTFENVQLRYRPGLPLALRGLSFTARAGGRLGVVGRTGAGKTFVSFHRASYFVALA